MNIEIIKADYVNKKHAKEIAALMNSYATDPMGGGKPLPEEVKNNLAQELSKLPYAFSVISYVDNVAAGLVTCFELFSTFSCKPLINIHDVIVLKEYRGNGLSHKMLRKVEEIAISKGCCKLTLEVLEGNKVAQSSYKKQGFSGYELAPKMGKALFWQKILG
jgi:ribosomal protein S18 acetylase RimI-like enzyme